MYSDLHGVDQDERLFRVLQKAVIIDGHRRRVSVGSVVEKRLNLSLDGEMITNNPWGQEMICMERAIGTGICRMWEA